MFKNATVVAILFASLTSMAFVDIASANSARCGTHIISAGARHGTGKYEVLKKCGEPTERFGGTWIYDNAGGKKVFRFDDAGKLMSIK